MSIILNLENADNYQQLNREIEKIVDNYIQLNIKGKVIPLNSYSQNAINYLKSAIYAKACYKKLKVLYQTYEQDETGKEGDMPNNFKLIRDIKDSLFDAFNNFYYTQGLLKLLHTPVGKTEPRLVTEQIAEKLLVPLVDSDERILIDTKRFIAKCLGEDISDTIENIPSKGINAPANACYFNSLIQLLNRIKPFVRELLDYQINTSDSIDNLAINALQKIFKNLNSKSNQIIEVKTDEFNKIVEFSKTGSYSGEWFECGKQKDNSELFFYFTSKLFKDRLLMNSFKINNQIHIICDSESKKFDVNVVDVVDVVDDKKKGVDDYCLNLTRTCYEGQTVNILTCLNNKIHDLEKITRSKKKLDLDITNMCNSIEDYTEEQTNYFVTKKKYYVHNNNQFIILLIPVTNEQFSKKIKIPINEIIMFYTINDKKIYYRPIALNRGIFNIIDGQPKGGHYIFKSIKSNGKTEMKSVLNISDSSVSQTNESPNNDRATDNSFNTSILYQRIDDNDKIYLDKDLNAIFDFVFKTKFQIDKAFYLINNNTAHIIENRPFLTLILNDIGIDLSKIDLGDFIDIHTKITECNDKYATDNDYQFIKQIYENIKNERNYLNNIIKNTILNLDDYLNLIYPI